MTWRLAAFFATSLLLAGCAAGPYDGGGYAYSDCGWGGACDYGPSSYAYGPDYGYGYGYAPGPSLSLNFGLGGGGDHERGRDFRGGDRARFAARSAPQATPSRAGDSGRHANAAIGRAAPAPRPHPQAAQASHGGGHDGGDHSRDHEH